jgi:hypothetical protein
MNSRFRKQTSPSHEVVLFFRELFNLECNSYRVTLRIIYLEADNRGLKAFGEKVDIYLTEEAQQITLELLSSGFNFTVEK